MTSNDAATAEVGQWSCYSGLNPAFDTPEAQFRERLRAQELLRYVLQASTSCVAETRLGTLNLTTVLALGKPKQDSLQIRQ